MSSKSKTISVYIDIKQISELENDNINSLIMDLVLVVQNENTKDDTQNVKVKISIQTLVEPQLKRYTTLYLYTHKSKDRSKGLS